MIYELGLLETEKFHFDLQHTSQQGICSHK